MKTDFGSKSKLSEVLTKPHRHGETRGFAAVD